MSLVNYEAYAAMKRRAEQAEAALRRALGDSPWDVDQDCRYCNGHYDWHDVDCPWLIHAHERSQNRYDDTYNAKDRDDVVGYRLEEKFVNLLGTRAEQAEAALEAIIEVSYANYRTKGDYAAFIRDLARNALAPPEANQEPDRASEKQP